MGSETDTLENESEDDIMWLIYFYDAEVSPEIFAGHGAAKGARRRFDAIKTAYSCVLLKEVDRG